MNDLLIHPTTKQALEGYAKAPAHALLLIGPSGVGKVSVAQALAVQTLDLKTGTVHDYAYAKHIRPEDGKSIGIESVRELEKFLSLKVPRNAAYNRAIIIEDADQLTTEAQNALLKTLEEPPEGTILILTASHEHSLLPTINSRVQSILVQKPAKQTVADHFESRFTDQDIEQAYALSSGLPSLMEALLNDDDHPLVTATQVARSLLTQSSYERLLQIDSISKDKQLAADITYILQQMAHVSLQNASGSSAKRWQSILTASHETADALRANAQPKLALTNLMLQL